MTTNREDWLSAAVSELRTLFDAVGKRGEQMADPGDTGERRSFCKLWGHLRHSTHLP